MREIRKIIVHCSASEWGDVAEITRWHKERGWETIGYHYVIHNPYPKWEFYKEFRPRFEFDGLLAVGRDINKPGAHVKGHNRDSIGICLIGDRVFTSAQFRSLQKLLKAFMRQYGISVNSVLGHCEVNPEKTCPNIDMAMIRDGLQNA